MKLGKMMNRNVYKQAASFLAFTLVALMVALSGCSASVSEADANDVTTQTAAAKSSSSALAVLAVDINPSVELTIDAAGIVYQATAVNEDAAALDLNSFIGMPADEAVEAIILAAAEAGFITAEDTTEDYVVISAVQLDETADTETLAAIETQIRNRIKANADFSTIELTVQNASIQSRVQAQKEGVPLGLYLLNQLAAEAGFEAVASVKDFFSNPELMALVEDEDLLAHLEAQQEIHETMEPGQGIENAGGANAGGSAAGTGGPGSGAGTGDPTGEPTGEPSGTGDGAGGVNRGGKGQGQGQGLSNN